MVWTTEFNSESADLRPLPLSKSLILITSMMVFSGLPGPAAIATPASPESTLAAEEHGTLDLVGLAGEWEGIAIDGTTVRVFLRPSGHPVAEVTGRLEVKGPSADLDLGFSVLTQGGHHLVIPGAQPLIDFEPVWAAYPTSGGGLDILRWTRVDSEDEVVTRFESVAIGPEGPDGGREIRFRADTAFCWDGIADHPFLCRTPIERSVTLRRQSRGTPGVRSGASRSATDAYRP